MFYRQLGDFKKKNKNKRFPEGSITAAYIQAECVTYCSTYLNDEDRVGESSGVGSKPTIQSISCFQRCLTIW